MEVLIITAIWLVQTAWLATAALSAGVVAAAFWHIWKHDEVMHFVFLRAQVAAMLSVCCSLVYLASKVVV